MNLNGVERKMVKIFKYLLSTAISLAYNVGQILFSVHLRAHTKRIKYLLLTPITGNIGDHAIAQGAIKILGENTVELVGDSKLTVLLLSKVIRQQDVIIITGGGFLGSLYKANETFLLRILQGFKNNKIVILPQTIYYEPLPNDSIIPDMTVQTYRAHRNLTIMCRESRSVETVKSLIGIKNVQLFPDTVLMTASAVTSFERCNTVVVIMRDDKEALNTTLFFSKLEIYCKDNCCEIKKIDTNKHKLIMPGKRNKELNLLFDELLKARFVVTDRLHGMIFSYITQTPCIAINNINGKVGTVYDDWLSDSGYVFFASNNDFNEVLSKISNFKQVIRQDDFSKYVDEIRGTIANG